MTHKLGSWRRAVLLPVVLAVLSAAWAGSATGQTAAGAISGERVEVEPERAAPEDQRVRRPQPPLSLDPDIGQKLLPVVPALRALAHLPIVFQSLGRITLAGVGVRS